MLEYKHKVSLPLTDMWYINGRVESIVLCRKVEDFFSIIEQKAENCITISCDIVIRKVKKYWTVIFRKGVWCGRKS